MVQQRLDMHRAILDFVVLKALLKDGLDRDHTSDDGIECAINASESAAPDLGLNFVFSDSAEHLIERIYQSSHK